MCLSFMQNCEQIFRQFDLCLNHLDTHEHCVPKIVRLHTAVIQTSNYTYHVNCLSLKIPVPHFLQR